MNGPPTRGGPQHIPRPDTWALGGPAPWIERPPEVRSLEDVQAALAGGPEPRPSDVEVTATPSAVLVPLYEQAGDVWVVLTRRSWQLRSHTGEVSFPGGRREAGDHDLWYTANREAAEEIALVPGAATRIGELHHVATVTSQSFIVPYVGALDGRPDLVANDDEVDAILHVPLAELVDPATHREERWTWGSVTRAVHFFEIEGDTIWGATGQMLVDLISRL